MKESDANPALEGQTAVPRRVWSSTALLVTGRIWGSICSAAALVLLARYLAPEAFGQLTFYLAIFALLDALTDFGTGAVSIQRSAHDDGAVPAVLLSARRIRLGMATIGFALTGVLVAWMQEPGGMWILVAALYPFTHALELSAVIFRNRIAWGWPVAIRAFGATVRLGIVLILWHFEVEQVALYLLATAGGSALANVLLHRAAAPHLPRPKGPILADRGLLGAALPLGVAAICQQAYFYVDNIFVRVLAGDAELGWYNAGVRLMSFLIMVAQYAPLTALPWLAHRGRTGDLGDAAARLGQPLLALAGLGAGLLWPRTAELLTFLFGPGFEAAGPALRWLLLATVTIYAGACMLTAVVASGKTGGVLAIAVAALAVNAAGNAWLVPKMGIEGAGLATFVTELVVTGGAALVLVHSGFSPFRSRPLRWLIGPVLFAAGAWLSG